MQDYNVSFTVRVAFTASNEDQAAKRADQIGEWLFFDLKVPEACKRPWLGDIDYEQGDIEED